MTRKQAHIPKLKLPTRATPHRSLDSYCKPLKWVRDYLFEDSYGTTYFKTQNGNLVRSI